MNILAISGSLRAASINTAFCTAVSELAPPSVNVEIYSGIARLPLFNPDQEPAPPAPVQEFRYAVGKADALLIAGPEYAHGISGVLKNALDWLVAYEGAVDKPVALINTSPRAHHAYDALRERQELLQAVATGLVDAAAGRVVDHEKVAKWLASWGTDDEGVPPL